MRRVAFSAIAIACALFTGCEYRVNDYPTQPPTLTQCDLTDVTIHVQWVTDVDVIARACNRTHLTYGCTDRLWYEGYARHAHLTLIKPKDFNDVPLLATIGHEVCHALGGTHKDS